jgi:hypothetical protein
LDVFFLHIQKYLSDGRIFLLRELFWTPRGCRLTIMLKKAPEWIVIKPHYVVYGTALSGVDESGFFEWGRP